MLLVILPTFYRARAIFSQKKGNRIHGGDAARANTP